MMILSSLKITIFFYPQVTLNMLINVNQYVKPILSHFVTLQCFSKVCVAYADPPSYRSVKTHTETEDKSH